MTCSARISAENAVEKYESGEGLMRLGGEERRNVMRTKPPPPPVSQNNMRPNQGALAHLDTATFQQASHGSNAKFSSESASLLHMKQY